MDRGTGDRGVSEVMGFVLVFGMLVLSFTIYQGIVVPDQNRQVEFEHNQAVQGQFQDLRNAIVTTAATDSGQAVSVTLGASYPTRALARNLGVSGGSVQTTEASHIRIDNAEALDGETSDYLDGSERRFVTKSIRYSPVYSFYSGAPETVYENTLLYNQFGDTNLLLTDQVVVDGRRITLIAINGSFSKTERDTVSISTEAISTSSNRIALRNTTGQRVTITVPTRLSATKWEEALEEEMGERGKVEAVSDVAGEDAVNITLEQGVTYELRMAKVGIGEATSEESPKYITAVQGSGANVPEGGTQKFVVEVRDKFNNPVSNVTVSSSSGAPDVGSLSSTSETTDSDGRASFTYAAPENLNGGEDVTVKFSFDGDGTANETVTIDVEVLDSDGSGGGGNDGSSSVNPSADQKTLVYSSATVSGNNVDLELNNTADEAIMIESVRFQFYSGSHKQAEPPDALTLNGGNPVPYLGQYTSVNVNVQPGINTVTLGFQGGNKVPRRGDFMIMTIQTGNDDVITYYIGMAS